MESLLQQAVEAHRAGRKPEAAEAYRRLLALPNPPAAAAHNLAALLNEEGRLEEALELWLRADQLLPNAWGTLSAIGAALYRLQRAPEAEAWLRRALELRPADDQVAYRLGLVRLAQGDLREGFALYEHRPSRVESDLRRSGLPEWRGEDLRGKSLLVRGEQGLGDELMMARFLPRLRELGLRRLDFAARPENLRLFRQLGADQILDRNRNTKPPLEPYDAWVMLGSLPFCLGVEASTLSGAPYLTAAPRSPAGGVGLMTRANPAGVSGAAKTLPPELADRLASLGPRDLDPAATGARDLLDTAEIVAGLDLVVTVDTSVAHLAGALGRPVWILLPYVEVDWRWGAGRADSPWYASARLFRQPRAGDWAAVVDEVERELQALR